MAPGQRSVLREGVVAGLIGAAVVALWFLVFDALRGQPFLTPAVLGNYVFFGITDPVGLVIAPGPIVGYTVIHGLAFIAFGVVAAALLDASEREPALLIAVVILFAAFEVFVFAVVGALGASMLGALVWWAILVGNFVAAAAMLWYFLLGHRGLPAHLVGSWAAVLREGVVAGLIGAAVVAVWFLAIDAIHGEALRTPRLLGTALLSQSSPRAAVLLYTAVHGLAFIAFGILGSVLVAGAERAPMFLFALVILFTSFEVLFFGVILILARWLLDEVAGWTIFVGNLLAATAMLGYYFNAHRSLAHRLTEAWADDD
jgi:hypothetical protein